MSSLYFLPTSPNDSACDNKQGGADCTGCFASWKQKLAEEYGLDHSAAESVNAWLLRCQSEAAEEAQVNMPSLSHKRRGLVTAALSLNSGGIDTGGAACPRPMSSPSTNTAAPQHEPITSLPPVGASPPVSHTPEVGHASVASRLGILYGVDGGPAQTSASALSPPNLHPSFVASLEHASLVETALVRTAENDAITVTSDDSDPSWQSLLRRSGPTTPSSYSAVPYSSATVPAEHMLLEHKCDSPACIRAVRRINDIRRLQDAFAKANVSDRRSTSSENLARASSAAYQVVLGCLHNSIIALIDALVRSPTHRGVVAALWPLLQSAGIDLSMVPALAGSGMGSALGPQHVPVYVGGDLTTWGLGLGLY